MNSPEFQNKLQQALNYRKAEAKALKGNDSRIDAREYLKVLREDPRYIEAQRLVIFNRWERLAQRYIPKFTEQDFKTAGKIFSGINNGVKAALLVTIAENSSPRSEKTGPGTYMPLDDMVDSFKRLFAGTELLEAFGYNTNHHVISYCRESLCGVGLVAEEYGLDNELVGFGITQEGVQLGVPAARLTLWYENQTNQSIFPVLGNTNSGGETRAPFNRITILGYLLHHPYNVRMVDLNTILGDDIKLKDNITHLRNSGLVEYKAVTFATGKVRIQYEVGSSNDLHQAPVINSEPTLQHHIINIIDKTDKDQLTGKVRVSIADVISKLPGELREKWKTEVLRHVVSGILSDLAKNKFLVRVNDFEGSKKQSQISLTKTGRTFFMQTILPVLLLASGRPLTQMQKDRLEEAGQNFASLAQTSAETYYPHSISSKKRAHQERIIKVINTFLVSEFLNSNELAEQTGITLGSVRKYIKLSVSGLNERVIKVGDKIAVLDVQIINGVIYYKLRNRDDFTQTPKETNQPVC